MTLQEALNVSEVECRLDGKEDLFIYQGYAILEEGEYPSSKKERIV
jgi:hypothetical protein